ncbi:type II secretion system F family protein [Thermoproteota archaeon]
MAETNLLAKKIMELLAEVEAYQQQKEKFISHLDGLFKRYQAGQFSYFDYEKESEKLLKGRDKEEWINTYNAYIYSLLKKIEKLNEQLFYLIYNDNSYKNIAPSVETKVKFPEMIKVEKEVKPKQELRKEIIDDVKESVHLKKKPVHAKPAHAGKAVKKRPVKKVIVGRIKEAEEEKLKIEKALTAKEIKKEERKEEPVATRVKVGTLLEKEKKVEKPVEMKKPSLLERMKVKAKKPVAADAIAKKIEKDEAEAIATEEKLKKVKLKAPQKNWFDRYVERVKPGPMARYKKKAPAEPAAPGAPAKKEEGNVSFGRFFGWDLVKIIRERARPKAGEAIGKKTTVGESTIRIETRRRHEEAAPEMKEQIEKITATALTEEAKRIKSILEKRQALRIYKPTFFGALANISTKKITLFMLEQFPEFFKGLYQSLRLANIKVLSNTYVNMMVFSSLASSIIGLICFGIIFSLMALPFSVIIVRTIFMAFVMGVLSFIVFYAYPFSKAKSRRVAINTNLPFAINHMAAVASSGVPPTKMFMLIAESQEYEEIATECEKIVNYIEIFGYDVLTAIKSVAVTTPSAALREFFNGMVSTTQSGGDVKNYLVQKADEAMLSYKLERKKYTETIATYSDIYTGILIAAPLFFVAALSLVSMLGGKVGGTNVDTVIVIGTYIVIPLLNIFFISFLKFTQPEV